MKAVLLAAGKGTRLKHSTHNTPKALVEVHGTPLIDYSLDFVKDYVDEICVVGGYYYADLKRYLESKDLPLRCIENPDYHHGSILSIHKALPFLTTSVLLMNIDHIYPKSFASRVFTDIRGIQACCDFDRRLTDDDMKVKLQGTQLTAISKTLKDFDGGYIGMTVIHALSIPAYVHAIQRIYESTNLHNVEYALQYLLERSYPISVKDMSGSQWFEIDSQDDLEHVNSLSLDILSTGRRSPD